MTTAEIMKEIIKNRCVDEVLRWLVDIVIERNELNVETVAEYKACLRAIHKINADCNGKSRDDAIAALSEVDT